MYLYYVIPCSVGHRLHYISQDACRIITVMCRAPLELTPTTLTGNPHESPFPPRVRAKSTAVRHQEVFAGSSYPAEPCNSRSTLLRTPKLKRMGTSSEPEEDPLPGESSFQKTPNGSRDVWRSRTTRTHADSFGFEVSHDLKGY